MFNGREYEGICNYCGSRRFNEINGQPHCANCGSAVANVIMETQEYDFDSRQHTQQSAALESIKVQKRSNTDIFATIQAMLLDDVMATLQFIAQDDKLAQLIDFRQYPLLKRLNSYWKRLLDHLFDTSQLNFFSFMRSKRRFTVAFLYLIFRSFSLPIDIGYIVRILKHPFLGNHVHIYRVYFHIIRLGIFSVPSSNLPLIYCYYFTETCPRFINTFINSQLKHIVTDSYEIDVILLELTCFCCQFIKYISSNGGIEFLNIQEKDLQEDYREFRSFVVRILDFPRIFLVESAIDQAKLSKYKLVDIIERLFYNLRSHFCIFFTSIVFHNFKRVFNQNQCELPTKFSSYTLVSTEYLPVTSQDESETDTLSE
ncbi:hypothetical protein PCE1_001008 [Barthelona sp. PCE]